MSVDTEYDDPTVPTPGQRVFTDSWGDAHEEALLITLADGTRAMATLHLDGTLRLVDPATGTPMRPPLPVAAGWPPWETFNLLRDAAGHPLVQIDAGYFEGDPVPLVWDPSTGARVTDPDAWTVDPEPEHTDVPVGYKPATTRVHALAALPDGRLASGHDDSPDVAIWDIASGRRIATIPTGARRGVSALAVVPGPDGTELLASGDYVESTIGWWDARTGEPVRDPVDAHGAGPYQGGVLCLTPAPLPDGRTLLASAGRDGTIRLWDPATGDRVGVEIRTDDRVVNRIAVVPGVSRPMMAVAGCDSEWVQRWDPTTGERIGEPLDTNGRVDSALTALRGPGGRPLIAAAGREDLTKIRLWDALTGEPVGELAYEADWVASVIALATVPTPAGDLLAATRTDGFVTLWDPATMAPVRSPLQGHVQGDPYNTLVTVITVPTPDGPALVSGGCDGTIRYWSPQLIRG